MDSNQRSGRIALGREATGPDGFCVGCVERQPYATREKILWGRLSHSVQCRPYLAAYTISPNRIATSVVAISRVRRLNR
jgi:hypothetical protein